MTPEQQRIAIAETCGWKPLEQTGIFGITWIVWTKGNEQKYLWQLPDYLNDLNAMHEAENVMRFDEEIKGQQYRNMLFHVVKVRPLIIHATAAQRAEAFLRTIGKWEDE
jgi:hypothetical protein